MPPKQPTNKKLSKQELKAQKKEQKEKKKEEAKKLAEERKRLAEEEAKRLEEEARLAWEAEQARLQAEYERISLEKESLSSFFDRRSSTLASMEASRASQDDRSYEAYKQTSETTAFAMAGDWKIYLWINLVKNPRLRVLNEPTLAITITIPKAFTFANVAIRFYHQRFNPLLDSLNSYTSVGGVFVLDILSIPPASRSANGWTFEHVTKMTGSVVRLGYPFAGDNSGVPSPIGLEFTLPATLILSGLPEIGWWDDEEECWRKDGITDVEYEKSSRILKFQTIRARPHAIIQSRVKYYPYHSWILTPISDSKALFILESHGHMIKIEIGSGWCKLVETPFCECKHIIGQELDPIILLKELSRCGLHLMPVNADGQFAQACIKFHASIMVTLRDSIARESLQKMEKGDPGFTECFKFLALGLRLFSFTSIEALVQPTDFPMEDALPGNDGEKEQIEVPAVEEKHSEIDLASAAPEMKLEEVTPEKVGEQPN